MKRNAADGLFTKSSKIKIRGKDDCMRNSATRKGNGDLAAGKAGAACYFVRSVAGRTLFSPYFSDRKSRAVFSSFLFSEISPL